MGVIWVYKWFHYWSRNVVKCLKLMWVCGLPHNVCRMKQLVHPACHSIFVSYCSNVFSIGLWGFLKGCSFYYMQVLAKSSKMIPGTLCLMLKKSLHLIIIWYNWQFAEVSFNLRSCLAFIIELIVIFYASTLQYCYSYTLS